MGGVSEALGSMGRGVGVILKFPGKTGFRPEIVSGLPSSAPQLGPPETSVRLCGQASVVQGPRPDRRAASPPPPSHVHRHALRALGLDLPSGVEEKQRLGRGGSRLSNGPGDAPPLTRWRATQGLIKPDGGGARVEAQRRFYI